VAGEWGHNPLPWPEPDEWPGRPCYCGRSGCVETFLSGPGLSADHAAATGDSLPAPDIAARAAAGDAAARATLGRYERRMARALAAVVNVLDPDVIVLGGGLSNLDRLYTSVPALWGAFVFSDRVDTRLVRARYGDASGVRGRPGCGRPANATPSRDAAARSRLRARPTGLAGPAGRGRLATVGRAAISPT